MKYNLNEAWILLAINFNFSILILLAFENDKNFLEAYIASHQRAQIK